MLKFVSGDFFDFDADVRVNTVNCVGVMGAGVALAFKKKYPDMFKDYVRKCQKGLIKPGHPAVWKSTDMFSKAVEIVNFPTKYDWRKPSEYEYIELGLKWLSEYLYQKGAITVTLPALGCGHGGLDWVVVKGLIEEHLGDSPSNILVFEPFSSKRAGRASSLPADRVKDLGDNHVEIISFDSDLYPDRLRRYTEKDIYCSSSTGLSDAFDLAIISSSKPDEEESKAISSLINYISRKGLSILFGGTASDKKFALHAVDKGVKSGVFLPSGILSSARKLKSIDAKGALILLSIGNPFEAFDRTAYMPSVLGRAFLSTKVIFTTDNFNWIPKHKKTLLNSGASFYHVVYSPEAGDDASVVDELKSHPINLACDNYDFL